MKTKHLLLLLIIITSCKDNISNEKFRNDNYVFYQEYGKPEKWLKINPNLKLRLPKSHSTYFFSNGSRFAEIEVLDSFPNREIKYFSKQDKLIRTTKYKSDSISSNNYRNGYLTNYHSNKGFIQSKGLIDKNKLQGKWKFYRADGKTIKQVIEYVNDTLHGIREDYWENGNLESVSNWNKGKEIGEGIIYHKNGNIDEKHFIKNGKINGRIEQFYQDGTKRFWANSWNGIVKDTSKYFYENGALKKLTIVSLDTITKNSIGKEYRYFQNGNIQLKSGVKNGLTNGIITLYYNNGNVKEKIECKMDILNGKYVSYFESGEKKAEGNMYNDLFNGTMNYYNKKGKLVKTINYNNGTKLDSLTY